MTGSVASLLAISVNGALGHAGLLLMLGASLVGAIATAFAIRTGNRAGIRQAGVYAWLILAGALLSTLAMQLALQARDYSLAYIQKVGSSSTPGIYNIAAMWSALEGSILLWVLLLGGYTAAVAWRFRKRLDDELVAWALVVMFVVSAFFALVSFGPANPFAAGPAVGRGFDGPGPNPLLQNHPLVLFHPPVLYLGYVGFTVPFAFAIAALITGRVGEGWLLETRRWALFAWGFLTLIHSVLVQQRRGMLRVWNLSLLVATFALTILGTFLTRSGIVNSVHAFGAGQVDGYLLGFFALVVIVSLGLIAWRGDRLRAPGVMDSAVSREGACLANNVIFTVFAFIVLLGTVFPLIVEAVQGRQTVVGAPYFDRLSMPIGIVLLFLMAVAPVLPWRKASQELLRDRLFWPAWCGAGALAIAVLFGADGIAPLIGFGLGGFAAGAALRQIVLATRRQGWRGLVGRANGGMIVHLGVIMVAVALVASNAYTSSTDLTLTVGEPVEWRGHTFEFVEVEVSADARSDVTRANVLVDGKVYGPALTTYLSMGDSVPTPSVMTGLTHDVYLTIAGTAAPAPGAETVRLEVFYKPLILWMWVGGLLMAVGTVLAAFPGRRRDPLDPVSAPIAGAPPAPAESAAIIGDPVTVDVPAPTDDAVDDDAVEEDVGV